MGIRFTKKLEPQWVDADDVLFDFTEIGTLPKELRKKCSFFFKPLTETQKDEVKKKATNKKGEFDGKLFSEIVIEEYLLDWKGVLDEQGLCKPCNPEEKKQMMDDFPNLAVAWLACIRMSAQKQIEKENKEQDNLEKN